MRQATMSTRRFDRLGVPIEPYTLITLFDPLVTTYRGTTSVPARPSQWCRMVETFLWLVLPLARIADGTFVVAAVLSLSAWFARREHTIPSQIRCHFRSTVEIQVRGEDHSGLTFDQSTPVIPVER